MSRRMPLARVLEDAEVFTDGDWVESKDQDPKGDVRLTQLADVGDGKWIDKSERFLTSRKAAELRCTYLKQGDVLVARMPDPLGRSCVFPGDIMPCVTVVDVCIIRPNPKTVDPRYLMRAINSPLGRSSIARHVAGTTRQRISRKNLSRIEIPLPPLPEQKRIAAILDAADALRAKRRESIEQLDSLVQATFLEMFGDPVANPKGWDSRPLGEVCLKKPEYGCGAPSADYDPAMPRYVRITDIDEKGELAGDRKSAVLSAKEVGRYRLGLGDVLFARSGATVGKTYLYKESDGYCVFAGYLIRFRPTSSLLLPQVLFRFTQTAAYRQWVESVARAVAQPNINAKMYSELKVSVPPLDLQNRFASIVEAIEQQKTRLKAHLAELDTLFASLQTRAFNGELAA